MDSERRATLQLSDDTYVGVGMDFVRASFTIRTMLEEVMDMSVPPIIPVHGIGNATLRRVLQWCFLHKDDPEPAAGDEVEDESLTRRTDDISGVDEEFLKADDSLTGMRDLYKAAEFLDIKGLLDLTCKYFANKIKICLMRENKEEALAEIRRIFQIQNDLTGDEIQQIKLEGTWCVNVNSSKD